MAAASAALGLRVMFMTPEDKTDADNLRYPAILYEKQRRPILTACMLGVEGAVRREGKVRHADVRRFRSPCSRPRKTSVTIRPPTGRSHSPFDKTAASRRM